MDKMKETRPEISLEIDSKGKKILHIPSDELGCCICKDKDWKEWYYCEQDKKVYCRACIANRKGCIQREEHIDWNIDMVKVIDMSKILKKGDKK